MCGENINIDEDIISLLRTAHFLGKIVLSMRRVEDRSMRFSMGISIKGGLSLRYNPEILSRYSLPQREAVIVHEALHVLNRHFAREEDIENAQCIFKALGAKGSGIISRMHKECLHEIFNYAADLSINGHIKGIPKESLFPKNYGFPEGLSAEEYFALLLKDMQQMSGGGKGKGKGNGSGEGGQEQGEGEKSPGSGKEEAGGKGERDEKEGSGKGKGKNSADKSAGCPFCEGGGRQAIKGKLVGDHSGWEGSQADIESAEALSVSIIKDCHERGLVPEEYQSMVKDILKPRVNWRAVLRTFVSGSKSEDMTRTWMRVNRRLPYVLKGRKREEKLSLVVAIDTSGSVSDKTLAEFSAELSGIAKESAEITVIECDATVQRAYKFERKIDSFKGRGGTAFTPVFDYLKDSKNRLRPDAVIYLTDGYGDDPKPFRKCSVLWVVTGDGQKPAQWGKVIFLPNQ